MIKDIIEQRRAVFPRQYNNDPIEKKEIEIILQASNWAPTHKRTEPWRFKIVRGDKLEELGQFMAECYKATAKRFSERKYNKTKEKFLQSSCVIVICMQRDPKERIPEWEEVASTAMAVQNMWLTAAEMDIGAYWSSTSLKKDIGGFIDLKQGEKCLGFFYMGKYDGQLPEGRREDLSAKIEWL